ncbi:hypothetical protein [Nocardia asiatica]
MAESAIEAPTAAGEPLRMVADDVFPGDALIWGRRDYPIRLENEYK